MATAMRSMSVALVALCIIIALAAAPGTLAAATSNAAAAPAPSSSSPPSLAAACEAARGSLAAAPDEAALAAACNNATRDGTLPGKNNSGHSAAVRGASPSVATSAAPNKADAGGMAPAPTPGARVSINATRAACILAEDDGFGGGGIISKFLLGPLRARSCAAQRRGNIRLRFDDCLELHGGCTELAIASRSRDDEPMISWSDPSKEMIREAENAIVRGGALNASFQVLETGNLSGGDG